MLFTTAWINFHKEYKLNLRREMPVRLMEMKADIYQMLLLLLLRECASKDLDLCPPS